MEEDNIQSNQEINGTDSIKHGKRAASHSGARRAARTEGRSKRSKDPNNGDKKRITARRIILIILVILLSIVAIAGAVFASYVYKAGGDITQAILSVTSDIIGTDEPIFVLVLGVSEDISVELTDTMILCGYNPKTQKAIMLSIPRDTFVGSNPSAAGGFDKINARYQLGVNKTVEAVESLTGVDITYYAVIQNILIPNLVQAVGSVEFDVPIDMNYDDPTQDLYIHLKKGKQLIDKDKAEQLLRFRHNNDGSSYPASYGDNDYGRMRTQREFIKAVAKNLSENGTPLILKNAASTVIGSIDTNLSLAKTMSYIPSALEFNVDNLKTDVLSVKGAMINSLYFAIANTSKNQEIVKELLNYLELDEKEMKKYYKPNMMRGQVTVPPQAEIVDNTIPGNYIVNNTVNNIIDNNTVNNIVNNTIENTIDDYANMVSNSTTVENTVPTETEHQHDYSIQVSIEKEPTCNTEGSGTYKCSKCDDTTTKVIPATGKHTYGDDGKCTVCGAQNPNYTPPVDDPPTNTTTEQPDVEE